MNVMNAITERRSIRQYSSMEVAPQKLAKVLEAGRLAPSASNRQDWKFIAVRDEKLRLKLAEAAGGQMFVHQAPIVLVVCGLDAGKMMMCGQYCYNVDASIAMAYMQLEAWELGLGTCWLGHFSEEAVKDILGIPGDVRVVAMSPLGFPAESPSQRPRKPLEQVVCHDRYQ